MERRALCAGLYWLLLPLALLAGGCTCRALFVPEGLGAIPHWGGRAAGSRCGGDPLPRYPPAASFPRVNGSRDAALGVGRGGRNFFPARSRRRSGARGLRAALSFAAAPSRVPGAVRTEPRAPPGRAPRWGGRSAQHPPRGALGPQPGKSPRPPERDENRPFELRDRPRGKPFRLRGAPSTRAVQRAPCAGTPPGRATPRRSAARPRGAGGGSRCRVKSFFLQFAVREE